MSKTKESLFAYNTQYNIIEVCSVDNYKLSDALFRCLFMRKTISQNPDRGDITLSYIQLIITCNEITNPHFVTPGRKKLWGEISILP